MEHKKIRIHTKICFHLSKTKKDSSDGEAKIKYSVQAGGAGLPELSRLVPIQEYQPKLAGQLGGQEDDWIQIKLES